VNQATAETGNQGQGTGSQSSFDPLEATVSDVVTAIVTGQETTVSITEQYLARIEEYDEMEAIITVNDNAIDRAETLDEQFAESGVAGPLHGVPLILKDNNDTADMPTTAGSLALRDSVPPDDAFLVRQLRNAGGIVLAKANLHEFARGIEGFSSAGGQTRNPYDLGRNPGGSSSGTGAAIGANLGVVGTGTDTCGSVRIPSAFQSLVGLRPTMGLLSRDGIVPLKLTQDTLGPMTRTVRDTAITMDVLVGYDPADPITARGAQEAPPLTESSADSYTDFLRYDGLEDVRIGILRNLFGADDDAEEEAEADAAKVTSVVNSAIEEMGLYGAEIVDPVEVPNREELLGDAGTDWDREFKRDLNNYLDSLEDPRYESVEELEASGLFACRDLAEDMRGAVEADAENLDENSEFLRANAKKRATP
jgi:Asp-tRNA(Asn)/Glu-tRNA(Gln) amidotransferase A subunit family amidase